MKDRFGRSRRSRLLAASIVIGALAMACSSTQPSPEAFCSRLEQLDDLSITLGGDPAVLQAASRDLAGLADVAPDEVRPSVEVLSRALDTMGRAAAQAGSSEAANLDAAIGALKPDIATIEDASANVDAYARDNCRISLMDSPTTVEPS